MELLKTPTNTKIVEAGNLRQAMSIQINIMGTWSALNYHLYRDLRSTSNANVAAFSVITWSTDESISPIFYSLAMETMQIARHNNVDMSDLSEIVFFPSDELIELIEAVEAVEVYAT